MKWLKLVSSNEHKLKEFKRFGMLNVSIEKGRDLKEVDSDGLTVAIYKSIEAGEGRIVDDTSLYIDGTDIGSNIKWLMDDLPKYSGREAIWCVYLGVNDGEHITIYEGKVAGIISDKEIDPNGFGFDSIFIPNGTDLTLSELTMIGKKELYSARKVATENLLWKREIYKVKISSVEEWDGEYQNS